MSSLAAQLAQSASRNAVLLADRSRRKPGQSYLFTGREANQHDLESIHALGINGLLQLASLSPSLLPFAAQLFSDQAKTTDRTLLSTEANAELDESIENCLSLLGPYLMEIPTGKVIEWLVRRFRINEFNVEAVLSLFLPYHESPHFAKMITILHITQNSIWNFLLRYKSAAQTVPRVFIVAEMLRNSDFARFVISLLPSAAKGGYTHRVLLAFNAATLYDFITRNQSLNEGILAYLLPALLEPLDGELKTKDTILGTFVLLSALSQKCQIAPAALKTILGAMASCAGEVSARQFTNTILSVCEPQAELERFSDKTVIAIAQLPKIGEEMRNASNWVGIEKVICPLLRGLINRLDDDNASSLLETILATPNFPTAVIEQSSKMLITFVISAKKKSGATSIARRLLSNVQQRYTSVFNEVLDQVCRQSDSIKESVTQLGLSLSMTHGGHISAKSSHNDDPDMVSASTDADPRSRVIAVKSLILTLTREHPLPPAELQSIHSALLARVQDTDQHVLSTLYSQPSIIVPFLIENAETYIAHVSGVLSTPGSTPKRSILRIHLTFLISQFCRSNSLHADGIFHRMIFPFLLFSKPRQHTADVVWDIITNHLDTLEVNKTGVFEWLTGCALAVKSEQDRNGIDTLEKMSITNKAISSQMAQNILKSNSYTLHFNTLFAKLQDPNPHVKVLTYLIARDLLGQLSGEHQIDAAHRILKIIDVEQFSRIEHLPIEKEKILDFVENKTLTEHIVMKPSSVNTLHWLQISVVTLASAIRPPAGPLNWLTSFSNTSDCQSRYVGLMRTIYRLANTSTLPLLTLNLLQALFVNIGEQSLAFLVGVWIGSTHAIEKDDQLRIVALRHAAAFLEAHVKEDNGTDFQTILPSLLVAVQSHDNDMRRSALDCISRLGQLADRRFSSVYGFDTIYGQSERQLQYLDRDDLKKYLDGLVEHRDHLAHDPNYLRLFHQQHIGRGKADKKRDTEYKHRMLCYILSHINACALPMAQIALLNTIDTISDSAKAGILLPTIKSWATSLQSDVPYESQSQQLIGLLISCFDVSVADDLNKAHDVLWDVFVSMLRCSFAAGASLSSRVAISRALEHGLFASLKLERKVVICDLLLDIGSQGADTHTTCKQLLGNLVHEVPLIVHMLDSIKLSIEDIPRASKRAKLTDVPEDPLPRLSLFVEVLGTVPLPGSFDLVSHLLDTLNRVMHSASPTQADISYVEQLLMSAIENAAEKIVEIPNLSPSTIRLDVLVELIRVADNPQTFHQALLLMANLTRLAPDSVLHNVMPVFTFMGSNVFHRDDTYSFKVVQQTVDSIVPIMVSSLKRTHSHKLDLYIGSKDFLRVFTDAANHIPRHRRTKFFTHLVDVLGSDDFLPPICMLLVEKIVNRVIRQNIDEVQTSLSLPSSILQHNSSALQIRTLTEILRESQRLAARIIHPGIVQPTFLEVSIDDDHSIPLSVALRRRAQALVTFVGYALKSSTPVVASPSSNEEAMGDLVAILITLATLQGGTSAETKVDDICHAAQSSMNRALSVMSAVNFIDAVLSMIESGEPTIQEGALGLLSDRLTKVSLKTRQEISPKVVMVINIIKKILTSHPEGPTSLHAFRALRSIGLTLCDGEKTSVAEAIPAILLAIKGRTMAPTALAALSPLAIKLGPRIIPYFREIVSHSVPILRDGTASAVDDALSVLHGLLSSIPAFWSAGELVPVITLYLDHCASMSGAPSSSILSLMKAITKRVPAKVLLPTMIEMWNGSKIALRVDHVIAYFDLLARALRSATRPVVLEQLRPLFKIFQESFDINEVVSRTNDAEIQTIVAFKELVVKLNEAAFRPLFRRLYDWAFASEIADTARKIKFCHIYVALLDFFKGLMNPYMSFLLEPFVETLQSLGTAAPDNQMFWMSVIEITTKSLTFDDGAFWRDDKLRLVTSLLVEQVAVCIRLNYTDGKSLLQECLAALIDSVTDDTLLKSINLDLLMHTRSDDVRLRLFALTCSETLWRAHGGKLLGFVAETTTFIAECSEDDNDMVVRESFKLKDAVENVAGTINGL